MPTAAEKKEIRDRQRVTDHVCDYMHENHRAMGIDALLTRPADALRMGVCVAARAGRISDAKAKKITRVLEGLIKHEPDALDAADEVCRAALSSRKRGDLKRDRY